MSVREETNCEQERKAAGELDSPDNCKPEAQIKELHESLGFSDWETEMKLSREAAEAMERKFKEETNRRGRSKRG